MGGYATIAAVTQALYSLLQEAIRPVAGASVRTARPDRLLAHEQSAGTVNVFLYQMVPNAQWRNTDVPTRTSQGGLVQRPRLALDLYYLISFYGQDQELVPQVLAGLATAALHTQPCLVPGVYQPLEGGASPPPSDPTAQPITFYPVTLNLEEMSKIWLILQAPYALSVAYRGSVVVIDTDLVPETVPAVEASRLAVLPRGAAPR